MAHDLVACPVCAGTDFTPLSVQGPKAVRCAGCDLGIELSVVLPRDAYAPAAYDAARDHGGGCDRWKRFHHDSAVAQLRLAQLEPVLPPKRGVWVDVGCGNGAFLAVARRRGWGVVGVEATPDGAKEVADRLDVPVLPYAAWAATARGPAAPKAAAVSFLDVIEHLIDPVHVLKTAALCLDGDGALVVEVPDLDACDNFDRWHHRRAAVTPDTFTEHLYHFSKGSLERLAALHLPDMRSVRFSSPVPGKLQAVWRKVVTAPPPQPAQQQARQAPQRAPAGARR